MTFFTLKQWSEPDISMPTQTLESFLPIKMRFHLIRENFAMLTTKCEKNMAWRQRFFLLVRIILSLFSIARFVEYLCHFGRLFML